MNGSNAKQLPSISGMLAMIKRPQERKSPETFDKIMLIVLIVLFLAIGVFVAIAKLGWMEMSVARTAVLVLLAGLWISYIIWVGHFILAYVRQLRHGYKAASEETERRVSHELSVLDTFARYPEKTLKEAGRLVELEAKRWTRRGGVGAAFAAAFAVGLNLMNASIKLEEVFPNSETVANVAAAITVTVYASTFGILLGAAMIYAFASRLEKLAGLLSLAAERAAQN